MSLLVRCFTRLQSPIFYCTKHLFALWRFKNNVHVKKNTAIKLLNYKSINAMELIVIVYSIAITKCSKCFKYSFAISKLQPLSIIISKVSELTVTIVICDCERRLRMLSVSGTKITIFVDVGRKFSLPMEIFCLIVLITR